MKRLALILGLLVPLPAMGHGPDHGAEEQTPATLHAQAETAGHGHGLREVPAEGAPAIRQLILVDDAVEGLNLYLVTEDFTFAPQEINQPHVAGHGHAHIYVDGVKLTRLYGPAYHLTGLAPGQHRVEVTLNANDHAEYAVDGQRIAAATTVIIR